MDDFTYLQPKFDTDFTVTKQNNNYETTSKSGPFEKAILDKHMLGEESDVEELNRYAVYHGGDWPQERIINNRQAKKSVKPRAT